MSKKNATTITLIAALAVGLVAVPIVVRYTRKRRRLAGLDGEDMHFDDQYNGDINFDDGRRPLFSDYQVRGGRLR